MYIGAVMSRTPTPATVHGTATRATSLYDQLRADLLAGELEPGTKLAIEALAEHYETSATPLREALNRLVSDGLVERREQRGFVVSAISAEDLAEITKTRCWLEEVALRESIACENQNMRPWHEIDCRHSHSDCAKDRDAPRREPIQSRRAVALHKRRDPNCVDAERDYQEAKRQHPEAAKPAVIQNQHIGKRIRVHACVFASLLVDDLVEVGDGGV